MLRRPAMRADARAVDVRAAPDARRAVRFPDGARAAAGRAADSAARAAPVAVVEIGQRDARQPLVDRFLDIAQVRFLVRRDERERRAGQLGARRRARCGECSLPARRARRS